MKFSEKKQDHKFPEKKEPNYKNVWVDWKKYMIDFDSSIPYGKYIGKSLEWVRDNDEWYYKWIEEKNLFGSWGLIKEKDNTKEISPTGYFISSSEEKWIELLEKEISTKPSPFL